LKQGAHVIGTVNAEKSGLVFTQAEVEAAPTPAPPPAAAPEEKPASVK